MTTVAAPQPVSREELDLLVSGRHGSPHSVLGPHVYDKRVTVRAFRPLASSVGVVTDSGVVAMSHEHQGIWVTVLPQSAVTDYRLEVSYADHPTTTTDDPYRYLPTMGELDQHLFNEGRHEQLWDVLGAHVRTYDTTRGKVTGTSFAVWAPNARGVRLSGDFNFWDPRAHPMRQLGSSGVWELFVPEVGNGTLYKYVICGADEVWREKADPMATFAQKAPDWASIVFTSEYSWADDTWIENRATRPTERPMSVYEVHLGSWRRDRSYLQLADELVNYVKDLGFTHVELLPVMEHPFGGSWGYHVTGYFAATSRFGTPDEFRYLVDSLHQAGIGVLLDWVPGHFATDPWALAKFDGTALYEHADPQKGWHAEWGSFIFDFGRREVRNFLVANALYWLEEFHIDGLRVDGVASMLYLDYSREAGEWTPNQYGGRENLEAVALLQEVNATCYKRVPGTVVIAEESTAWPGVTRPTHLGGLGFGFKWNMGWMHDSLDYMAHDPIHRQYHHHQMTFSMMYAYTENYVLPISHDEVVHGKGSLLRKMPGDRWRQLANLRALLGFMWAHPGKQLIFMGVELAQESEWAESRELDWWLLDHIEHLGVHRLVKDLNRVYTQSPALWSLDQDPKGFSWIDANDSTGNVFSFLRTGKDGSSVACVANFSAVPRHDYSLGLPAAGRWDEVLNSDAESYSGSGVGNLGAVTATARSWHGRPASAIVQLPPLATVWLRHTPAEEPAKESTAPRERRTPAARS
ncbi:MAG TPA: 1,4-alpha-glucan branching protein GlgB [Nocardioidaceae bacterium]|nr:1,4-alpha-glucan branching protein GlgB [Nocardioidaceae bacterium]